MAQTQARYVGFPCAAGSSGSQCGKGCQVGKDTACSQATTRLEPFSTVHVFLTVDDMRIKPFFQPDLSLINLMKPYRASVRASVTGVTHSR